MMEQDNSFFRGRFVKFQRGLYVQPPKRHIDFNTVPNDGNEFIHKARLENSRLDFSKSSDIDMEDASDSSDSREDGLRKVAAEFAHFANELKISRESLKNTFPPSDTVPVRNEIECCAFCLGSQKCWGIYDCGPLQLAEAHKPLISIVIHLTQSEINKLLKYTLKWYKVLGMDNDLARWVFSLFACTTKPLTDSLEAFLLGYLNDLKMHLQECDEEESQRVGIMMSILENYFVLINNKHGGAYLSQICGLRS